MTQPRTCHYLSVEKVAVTGLPRLPAIHRKMLTLVECDGGIKTALISVIASDPGEIYISVTYNVDIAGSNNAGLSGSASARPSGSRGVLYLTQFGMDSILRKEGDLQLDMREQ